MSEPHWLSLHIAWAEDFIFWQSQQDFFVRMAQKHPNIKIWHQTIAGLKGLIRYEQKKYRKIYGEKWSMNNLEKKVLIEWIHNSGCALNSWEQKFLSHVTDKPYQLTKKEANKLVELYEKSSGGGQYQKREVI